MPKGVKKLEYEIADWKHYKMMGTWIDGRKPYRPFTHTDADDQIKKLENQLEKAKAKEAKSGGTRRRRGTRKTRRR